MEKEPHSYQKSDINSSISRRRMITTASAGAISAIAGSTLLGQERRRKDKSSTFSRSLELETLNDPKVAAFVSEMANLSKVAIAESLANPKRRGPAAIVRKQTKGAKRNSGETVAAYLNERKKDKTTNDAIIAGLLSKGSLNFGGKSMSLKKAFDPKNRAHVLDRFGGSLGKNDKLKGLLVDKNGNPPKTEKAQNSHYGGILTRMDIPWDLPGSGSGGGTPPPNYTSLKYRLHKIDCQQDTSEAGKDEISLAGMAFALNQPSPMPVNELAVGKFKTGDEFVWQSPLTFKQYSLTGANYPSTYVMDQVLAETDWNGLSDFISDLYESVDEEVDTIIEAVSASIGTAIANGAGMGTIAGPVGTVVGAIIGAVVSSLIGAIVGASKDDIFPVMMIGVQLPFSGGGNTTPVETTAFSGFGGTYNLDHSWEVS